MLHLASLVCNGCEAIGKPNFFFDHSIKRPVKGECGHFLCDKCTKKNLRCPNCSEIECSKCGRQVIKCDKCRRQPFTSTKKTCSNCIIAIQRCRDCSGHTYFKPVIKDGIAVINYGLLNFLEMYEKDCIKVYRNWWKGAELGEIGCGNMGCKEGLGTRICVDCNGLERLTPMKCLWINKDTDKAVGYQERLAAISDKPKVEKEQKEWFDLSSESEPEPEAPPPPFAQYRLSVVLHKNHLTLLKSNLLCSDCIIDTQKENPREFEKCHRIGHKSIKLSSIRYLKEDVKKATAQYAGEFLWKIMRREADTKCKLRHMRLLRTCEVLIHLANISCPFIISQNFEQIGMREEGYWSHKREYSRVSKYFEALDFEKIPEKERIDLLIDSVEYQWNEYKKINKNCGCTEKWHNLRKETFGNQVEKHYCEIINNTGLEEKIDDCPGNWPKNAEILGKMGESVEYWEKKTRNSPAVYNFDVQVLKLMGYFKKNALEVLKNWWESELAPGEGYCMPCRSFSTQLELCTYCEFDQRESALHRGFMGKISIKIQGASIQNLAKKWQCSECKSRLSAGWKHTDCVIRSDKYSRGCNHLRNRLEYGRCSSMSNCAQTIVKLAEFQNSGFIWKAATWHIVRELLIHFLGKDLENLNDLDYSIQEYFEIAFDLKKEKKQVEMEVLKAKIEEEIEKLTGNEEFENFDFFENIFEI